VQEFVGRVLDPQRAGEFLADLREFAGRVAGFGAYNSLAQSLLRCTAPGVPDTYQGTELWDLSLVDPDNRRPVDYDRRGGLLWELDQGAEAARGDLAGFAAGLLKHPDGRAKLVSRALRYRRSHADLFRDGEYLPLEAADHVFAFARRLGDRAVVVAVPRLVAGLTGDPDRPPVGPEVWGDTGVTLADGLPGRWANLLTGEELAADGSRVLPAGQVFARFPVALLEGR
jgi:(1->4)-alpha-D-glucan 1-alpha-D-glucosylmutase